MTHAVMHGEKEGERGRREDIASLPSRLNARLFVTGTHAVINNSEYSEKLNSSSLLSLH